MWFEAGTDVTIPIDFIVDGEFVVPDAATYKVRAHDGTVLASGALSASATSEELAIPAANNSISSDWENRYVQVEFTSGSKVFHRNISYKLSAFIPLTASPDMVRGTIGVNERELPDKDIDLIEAYFSLVENHGSGITEALTERGARNAAVNEAVVVKAAIRIMDSVPLRAMLTVRTEDSSASRSKDVDFSALSDSLQARLAVLINTATNVTPTSPLIFEFSTPADPFTQ